MINAPKHKERDAVEMVPAGECDRDVKHGSQQKEDHVGWLAADVVRCARPEKSPGHIKEAEQPDKAAGARSCPTRPRNISWIMGDACSSKPMPAVTFRNRTPQRSQNCGGVKRRVHVHIVRRDHARDCLRGGVQPAGLQFGRRHPNGEDAEHHERKIDQPHDQHRLPDPTRCCGMRKCAMRWLASGAADHGAAAESHDRQAGGQARAVREPFDQR